MDGAQTVDGVQLFEASTLYGAATLAAALDAGQFGPREGTRRILVATNNAAVPETSTPFTDMNGFAALRDRFDEVVDWNAAIRPHHPSGWAPRGEDVPLWERAFRHAWKLGDAPLELAVESIHAGPGKALSGLFATATLHVYADGLMSYGPTRNRLPRSTASRIQRLLHLDLVRGLRPMLLTEHGVEAETVPDDAFTAVLGELGAAAGDDPALDRLAAAGPTAVLLGQYLAALGILEPDEEEELHARMLRGAAAAGHEIVAFKPHPSAPARYSQALEKAAADSGVRLHVLDSPVLAEAVYARCRPRLVVGCFSTALLTAATYYGIPIARVGTGLLLDRLTPYENSNRVPVTLVDAVVPAVEDAPEAVPDPDPEEVTGLVRAVGFCMQAALYPRLRTEVSAWLSRNLNADTRRYFRRRRLTSLVLPGGGTGARTRILRRYPQVGRVARRVRAVRRAARG
ncbi:alpha-2,8-polysialyltransferase family protein [Streptomyces sp. JJ36]|uniref:alpha-2,8-polysialyltransferase family protein n=1 Tax=Streptomyces sp. JJ36 TaxID=2736645 RepID=UPI001F48CE1D|nr:alpha-2,8-polysialyltransferase family protein [Streptomyces sp. JJ36]MCF6525482.1 hypothetical protein [Streptomyces sp. JJ36]